MKFFMLLLVTLLVLFAPPVKGQLVFGCATWFQGAQVVPPVNSPGSGSFRLWNDACAGCSCGDGTVGDSLSVSFDYHSLVGIPKGATLYIGDRGTNGVFFLRLANEYFASGDTLRVPITYDECFWFIAPMYVIIETDAYPDGEIRGQLDCSVTSASNVSWGSIRALFR